MERRLERRGFRRGQCRGDHPRGSRGREPLSEFSGGGDLTRDARGRSPGQRQGRATHSVVGAVPCQGAASAHREGATAAAAADFGFIDSASGADCAAGCASPEGVGFGVFLFFGVFVRRAYGRGIDARQGQGTALLG